MKSRFERHRHYFGNYSHVNVLPKFGHIVCVKSAITNALVTCFHVQQADSHFYTFMSLVRK